METPATPPFATEPAPRLDARCRRGYADGFRYLYAVAWLLPAGVLVTAVWGADGWMARADVGFTAARIAAAMWLLLMASPALAVGLVVVAVIPIPPLVALMVAVQGRITWAWIGDYFRQALPRPTPKTAFAALRRLTRAHFACMLALLFLVPMVARGC